MYKCRKCGIDLIVGENCTQGRIDTSQYICRSCKATQQREHMHRTGQCLQRIDNRSNPKCRKCGVGLVAGENCTQNMIHNFNYICQPCKTEKEREYQIEYLHRTGRRQPMSENRSCASFLGVHVAERVLSHVFKDVERMPTQNSGYDFICNKGKKIDVKSACIRSDNRHANRWGFHIFRNKIADYFLCLAFDNRTDLNPLHVWLIPGGEVNDHVSIGISETSLPKWDQYSLNVERVSECCNIIKGGQ